MYDKIHYKIKKKKPLVEQYIFFLCVLSFHDFSFVPTSIYQVGIIHIQIQV